MLRLLLKTLKHTVDFNLAQEITLISGDSGTGKTYVCSLIANRKDTDKLSIVADNKRRYDVKVIETVKELKDLIASKRPHSIFIDNMFQWDIDDRVEAEEMILDDVEDREDFNYYVIMYRGISSIGFVEPKYSLRYADNTFKLVEGRV